jgi:hypothetical protein
MAGSIRPYLESAKTVLVAGDKIMVDSAARGTEQIDFTALSAQLELVARKGVASGYAGLGADGLVPATQLQPSFTAEEVADAAARNALTVVAGEIGKRLVMLTDTGVYYIAIATGTGASKWQVYNSIATASTTGAGAVELATNAEAVTGTDTARAVTPAAMKAGMASEINARAPAQELTFDGTVGATVTNVPAFGTGDFTVAAWVTPSTVATTQTIISGNTNSFALRIGSPTGVLQVGKVNASDGTNSTGTIAAGKTSLVAYVRSGATVTYYINGIASGTSDETGIDYSVACTRPGCFGAADTQVLNGAMRGPYVENRALTAAEVLALYETGAPPASDFNSASNTAFYTSNFSAGVDSWGTDTGRSVTGNVDSINGSNDWLKMEVTSGPVYLYGYTDIILSPYLGKRVRATVTIFNPTGSGLTHFLVGSNGGSVTTGAAMVVACAENTQVTSTVEFIHQGASHRMYIMGCAEDGSGVVLATGKLFYAKAVSIYAIGLLLAPESNAPGNGYLLNSAPGVAHSPIVLPATGVSFALPDTRTNRIRGTSATSGNELLLGATYLLPAESQILAVRARSRAGTPTVRVGNASAGEQIVADVALSTTWKSLTIALTGGIVSAAAPIYIGSNSADVVEIDIRWEPLDFS